VPLVPCGCSEPLFDDSHPLEANEAVSTEEKLERHGMKMGPAMRLVKFAKECKDEKLRAFSSYKTKKELKEVLRK